MTDEKKPDSTTVLSDEQIEQIVRLVEAAEIFARTMGLPSAAAGARMMLKATQVYAKLMADRTMGGLLDALPAKPKMQ